MYAGCKFFRPNANKFMTPNGYKTSSKVIKNLIKLDGLESFRIIDIILHHEIVMPFGWNSVYAYETWFIRHHNCADSPIWLNICDNSFYCNVDKMNSSRTQSVLQKYGVTNVSQLEEIKAKKIETCVTNYGVSHHLKNKEIRQAIIETNNAIYGSDYATQNDVVKEKTKATTMHKYGVDNVSKSDEIKLKKQQTFIDRYGVTSSSYLPQTIEKSIATINHINSTIIKCEHCDVTGSISKINTFHNKYCPVITGQSRKIPYTKSKDVTCPYCGKTGKSRGMRAKHFEYCKYKD